MNTEHNVVSEPAGRAAFRKAVYAHYYANHLSALSHDLDVARRAEWLKPHYEHNYRDLFATHRLDRVLDLGCGDGCFLAYMQQYECMLEGVDVSPEQIERARDLLGSRALLHCADITAFLSSQPSAKYDVVFLEQVLEHLTQWEALTLLQQVRRVLRCSGVLIMTIPNAASPAHAIHRYVDITHELGLTESSAAQLLRVANIECTECRSCDWPNRSMFSYPLRLTRRCVWQIWRLFLWLAGSRVPSVVSPQMIVIGCRREDEPPEGCDDVD